MNKTTNVQSNQLNYDHYSMDKYDRDIINSIPFHQELHEKIMEYLIDNYQTNSSKEVLDLGVGTGITSKIIKDNFEGFRFCVVDFSEQMLDGAKKKLGEKNVEYLFGDYAKLDFEKKYDIIISVIGIHHQNNAGKKELFKKIYSLLNNGGIFIFGDLVTHKNLQKAALNQAKHLHHLVEKATDEKTLEDWAYHHIVLNDLAPVEDQIEWLKEAGFKKVNLNMIEMNTSLIVCEK